ncbi:uncharacterized protein LOC135389133 isoform X1 [Ornithodoros turicata]|uniref:uncharacterized protein LOC135389133 isoform X1 n=1 Tax=Ornithodoros turicata TaxID=34597 RepID=UPI00313861E6
MPFDFLFAFSKRTMLITISIWSGVFLVFFSVAVALSAAVSPFYSFLIIPGFIASTASANLYVNESRRRRAGSTHELLSDRHLSSFVTDIAPIHRRYLQTVDSVAQAERGCDDVTETRLSSGIKLGSLKRSSSCLNTPVKVMDLKRSFSTPRMSLNLVQETPVVSFTNTRHTPGQEYETRVLFHVPQDVMGSPTNEAPSIPCFWNEAIYEDNESRPESSVVTATPLLSSTSLQSKASRVKRDVPSPSTTEEDAAILASGSSFWSMEASSSQGFYRFQETEAWETPMASPPGSKGKLEAGAIRLVGEVATRMPHVQADGDAKSKKLKKKLKLVPRFLKTKKEFMRFK